ncbi:hypothetical protein [Cerasicoccus frondis]|uniref:hypothetical protein n=1 Tax=Cerasicoccus frondis TaxID=490090 RepID=UPI0028527FE2|nr:hypothetical protein [Cerasicoccus frondis]
MKNTSIASVISVLAFNACLSNAQVAFNDFSTYNQPFTTGQNGVSSGTNISSFGEYTWTDNSSIVGWYSMQDDVAAATYFATNGNNRDGDPSTYLFRTGGTSGSFGTLRAVDNDGLTAIGVQITNNTGSGIGSFSISYLGQQWQNNTGGPDKLIFQYSTDATSLSTGNWTTVESLTFDSLADSGSTDYVGLATTTGVLDTTISSSTPSISLGNGDTIWFRWLDENSSGVNQALSIDNVSITPIAIPEASTYGLFAGLGMLLFAASRKRSTGRR